MLATLLGRSGVVWTRATYLLLLESLVFLPGPDWEAWTLLPAFVSGPLSLLLPLSLWTPPLSPLLLL